jgi:hypothetical protein
MSWDELRQGAQDYTLTDDERSLYETVRGIDWLLLTEE